MSWTFSTKVYHNSIFSHHLTHRERKIKKRMWQYIQ